MHSTVTRATILWFVLAAVAGAAAVFLHLFRSAFGGGSNALVLAIAAYSATALAIVSVYRGVMTAAAEQDRARRNAEREREVAERLARWEGLRPRDR
ncbi:hypothetical protein [Intrasporangium sp.]|uniref:hypothetical protein n=1 Tax=Intrasporangium sp. TaxID=1925024 RepID=UPI00293B3065|nr:hypothetical protein [Intrasporangium sp.]MDV3220200.1 hypothetical protein [Intrasporangium sp.]